MNDLEIRIASGLPISGARHLSGRRRSGLASPLCPCCGELMFCIFSIDGTDPQLRATALGISSRDYDFFVCPACVMASDCYFTQVAADGTVLIETSWDDRTKYVDMVLPYPVAPLEFVEAPPPTEVEIEEMLGRLKGDGVYHRLCSHMLWGKLWGPEESASGLICPICQVPMRQVAIIDSDSTLPLQRYYDPNRAGKVSLNWVDGDYLVVFCCSQCDRFGYAPAH